MLRIHVVLKYAYWPLRAWGDFVLIMDSSKPPSDQCERFIRPFLLFLSHITLIISLLQGQFAFPERRVFPPATSGHMWRFEIIRHPISLCVLWCFQETSLFSLSISIFLPFFLWCLHNRIPEWPSGLHFGRLGFFVWFCFNS